MSDKRIRVNAYLTTELNDYLTKSASDFGMSKSAFLTMVIQSYKQQSNTINALDRLILELDNRKNDF